MSGSLEILGIVPARGGSKGIVRKNIRSLAGRPLVAWTFETARRCRTLTRVILSTDDAAIAAVGRQAGIEVPFLRPAELAGDASPATDYVRHALVFLAAEGYRPEVVVLLQPTCPLRTAADVDGCVRMLVESGADAVVSVCRLPADVHPRWQFEMDAEGGLRQYGGRSWEDVASARQALGATYTRNGAVYAFRREVFERTGSFYGRRVLGYEMPAARSINIDEPADWEAAERAMMVRVGGRPAVEGCVDEVRAGVCDGG